MKVIPVEEFEEHCNNYHKERDVGFEQVYVYIQEHHKNNSHTDAVIDVLYFTTNVILQSSILTKYIISLSSITQHKCPN